MNGGSRTGHRPKRPRGEGLETRLKPQLVALDVLSNTTRVFVPPI